VFVDAGGGLVAFDTSSATFVCAACGGVALDVAAVAHEMRRREVVDPPVLTCPACATEMLAPEDDPLAELLECPVCGQRFTSEEGTPRLLGDMRPSGDPELN
jgi:uncharacterized protein YbaR (Trm112 family)